VKSNPASGANAVIVAQGGDMGGCSLYAHPGVLKYRYNRLRAAQALS
jgi:hypothetical protein